MALEVAREVRVYATRLCERLSYNSLLRVWARMCDTTTAAVTVTYELQVMFYLGITYELIAVPRVTARIGYSLGTASETFFR